MEACASSMGRCENYFAWDSGINAGSGCSRYEMVKGLNLCVGERGNWEAICDHRFDGICDNTKAVARGCIAHN